MIKKRIGHVTFHYFPVVGGQEVYIKNLLRVFEENGFDNIIYQPMSSKANLFTKGIDKKIKFILTIPVLNRFIKDFKKFSFSCFLLIRIFSLYKDDVIIVHYAFHSWPLLCFKKKIIVLSHGVEWDIRYNSLSDKLHFIIAQKTFNSFTLVVNDSHYLRTLSLNISPGVGFFSEVSNKKWFIPNCVSNIKFHPLGERYNHSDDRDFILVPRQITVDRGIDLAIQTFSIISAKYKTLDLVIIGAVKDTSYKKMCDNLIDELNLRGRVVWNHNVNNDDIPKYYRSAILTLIPTLRREGTSLSALEAMSCKCPVVSTNVAGLADLPTVQANPEKEALANAIDECIKYRSKYSEEQFKKVNTIFNEENWANAWCSVVNSLEIKNLA